MRIGFDFDNTIVNYDKLFYKLALQQQAIVPSVPMNKLAVRDYLRKANKEDIWTQMQGEVYGGRMDEAEMYPQVASVMKRLKEKGHHLMIISHKTKRPFQGKPYDLHAAARAWATKNLCDQDGPFVEDHDIFFELSKEEKIARICNLRCGAFIDDLPEILLAEGFPNEAIRFLFDPEKHYSNTALHNIKIVSSWAMFASSLA